MWIPNTKSAACEESDQTVGNSGVAQGGRTLRAMSRWAFWALLATAGIGKRRGPMWAGTCSKVRRAATRTAIAPFACLASRPSAATLLNILEVGRRNCAA